MTQWGCYWRRECISTNLSFVLSCWTHPKLDLNSLFICGGFKQSCTVRVYISPGLCVCACVYPHTKACCSQLTEATIDFVMTPVAETLTLNLFTQLTVSGWKWMRKRRRMDNGEEGNWPYSGCFTLHGLFSLCIFSARSLHWYNRLFTLNPSYECARLLSGVTLIYVKTFLFY